MIPRRAVIFLAVAWILVVLYPDPGMLLRSVRNAISPQTQAEGVADLARRLPDDPAAVEAHVLERLVPYAFDWRSAGVPWYFPTAREALAAGSGDCESRAVVLAAVLTAKGIPNELRLSLDHIWVDYPGKRATALENPRVQVAGVEDGRFFIRWPQDFDLAQEVADQLAIYWTPAPAWRVLLLAVGLSFIALWNALARRSVAGRLAGGLLPAGMRGGGRRRGGHAAAGPAPPSRAARARLPAARLNRPGKVGLGPAPPGR